MKLVIYILLFIFCAHQSLAQKIHFTDTSNEWTYMYSNPFNDPLPPNFHYFKYNGDTTIKSTKYLRLQDSLRISNVKYVREDTLLEKVYYFNLHDSAEKILFDFNFKVGDTFSYSENCPIVLGGIDSFQHNGIWYRVQEFPIRVFEEIGSYEEIFSINCRHPDMWTKLVCFKNRGESVIIPYPSGYYLRPGGCTLNVSDQAFTENVLLFPNPANEESKMIFSYAVTGRLDIINILGQPIAQIMLNNAKEAFLKNVISQPGIYYYKVSDNTPGNNFTGKFVFQ